MRARARLCSATCARACAASWGAAAARARRARQRARAHKSSNTQIADRLLQRHVRGAWGVGRGAWRLQAPARAACRRPRGACRCPRAVRRRPRASCRGPRAACRRPRAAARERRAIDSIGCRNSVNEDALLLRPPRSRIMSSATIEYPRESTMLGVCGLAAAAGASAASRATMRARALAGKSIDVGRLMAKRSVVVPVSVQTFLANAPACAHRLASEIHTNSRRAALGSRPLYRRATFFFQVHNHNPQMRRCNRCARAIVKTSAGGARYAHASQRLCTSARSSCRTCTRSALCESAGVGLSSARGVHAKKTTAHRLQRRPLRGQRRLDGRAQRAAARVTAGKRPLMLRCSFKTAC